MKARLLTLALSALLSAPAYADGNTYSLQLGTGFAPMHMFLYDYDLKETLAADGQEYNPDDAWHPALSLSFVWQFHKYTEFSFTGGLSWYHYPVTQYGVFGTDPEGKPRYDLGDGHPAGSRNSLFTPTFTFQCRHIWNPDRAVQLYSGGGLGIVFGKEIIPCMPAVTPIGMRYGGRHLFFFLEYTYSPAASLLHSGLGWRF